MKRIFLSLKWVGNPELPQFVRHRDCGVLNDPHLMMQHLQMRQQPSVNHNDHTIN
jgi:hypothetical protein